MNIEKSKKEFNKEKIEKRLKQVDILMEGLIKNSTEKFNETENKNFSDIAILSCYHYMLAQIKLSKKELLEL